MAKKGSGNALPGLVGVVIWLAGILVSLAVGFGLVDRTLGVPGIHSGVTVAAGWIVVVLTILGLVLKVIDAVGN